MSIPIRRSRAFTVWELVIVIAVIAVITAVGITVYHGVIKNAKISKDIQTARQMQSAVTIAMPPGNADAADIVKILFKNGFAPDDLFASADERVFAWCGSEGTIVLFSEAGDVWFPAFLDGKYSPSEMKVFFIPLYTALSVVETVEDAPSEAEIPKPLSETSEEATTEEPPPEETTESVPEATEETATEVTTPPETTEETTTTPPEMTTTPPETTTTTPETTEEETTTAPPSDEKVTLIRSDDEFAKAVDNAKDDEILKLTADITCFAVWFNSDITLDLNGHTLTVALYIDGLYVRSQLLIQNGNIVMDGMDGEYWAGISVFSGSVALDNVTVDANFSHVFDMSTDTNLTVIDSDIDSDGYAIISYADVMHVTLRNTEIRSRQTAVCLQSAKQFLAEKCDIYAPIAAEIKGGRAELNEVGAYGGGGVLSFGGGAALYVKLQAVSAARTELIAPTQGVFEFYYDISTVTELFFDSATPKDKIFVNGADVFELYE